MELENVVSHTPRSLSTLPRYLDTLFKHTHTVHTPGYMHPTHKIYQEYYLRFVTQGFWRGFSRIQAGDILLQEMGKIKEFVLCVRDNESYR